MTGASRILIGSVIISAEGLGFLGGYDVHQAGGRTILEYWIPADDLDVFNANIVGTIEAVAKYQ